MVENRLNTWQWVIVSALVISTLFLYYSKANVNLMLITQDYFYDGLHFPGGVGLGILVAIFFVREVKFKALLFSVFTLALITGGLELLQYLSNRQVSWDDWLLGFMASCLGLLVATFFIAGLKRLWLGLGVSILLILSLLVNMTSFISFYAYLERDKQLPILTSFENSWVSASVWRPISWGREGALPEVLISQDWSSDGKNSLLLSTSPGKELGAMTLLAGQDWSPYQSIRFDVFNPLSSFELKISIFAGDPTNFKDQHKSVHLLVEPGVNNFRVELDKLRYRKNKKQLDLNQVQRLVFAVRKTDISRYFAIDYIRFE